MVARWPARLAADCHSPARKHIDVSARPCDHDPHRAGTGCGKRTCERRRYPRAFGIVIALVLARPLTRPPAVVVSDDSQRRSVLIEALDTDGSVVHEALGRSVRPFHASAALR